MIEPLGMDDETLRIKDKKLAYWKQFSAWRKGFKAGKRGKSDFHDNPYKLTTEIITLLQKRARWKIGYDEGDALRHKRALAKQKRKHKKDKKKKSHHREHKESKHEKKHK